MIRSEVIASTRVLDNYIEFTREFADRAEPVVTGTFDSHSPQLLTDLRFVPGAVRYPVEWTSEKQRRAYFATNGFGGGIPYKRKGKTARSWYAWVRRSGNRFEAVIANSTPSAKFVYGNIRPRGEPDPQQRFHRNTGWRRAAPIIDQFVNTYRGELSVSLRELAARTGAQS